MADATAFHRRCPGGVPLGLTPTTSTTLMTVIGDILVVNVMNRSGFTIRDYALRHHGGYLGLTPPAKILTKAHHPLITYNLGTATITYNPNLTPLCRPLYKGMLHHPGNLRGIRKHPYVAIVAARMERSYNVAPHQRCNRPIRKTRHTRRRHRRFPGAGRGGTHLRRLTAYRGQHV